MNNQMQERDFEALWEKYSSLLQRLEDENINNFLEAEGQRLLECSYSQRSNEPFCGIAGVIEYSLLLASTAKSMLSALKWNVPMTSVIKCALLSEAGRTGTLTRNRFKNTESEWHIEKLGQYYDWDETCPKYSVQHMTLFKLQHFGIKLSWEEWQAISLMTSMSSEENKFYGYTTSKLATLMMMSRHAILQNENEKNSEVVLPF